MRDGPPQVEENSRYHNNLFPNCSTISSDAIAKLKDMLIFAVGG